MIHVPADGPLDAKLAIVGMAPAKEEVALGKPFVGPSGKLLNSALLAAGMRRENVYVTNIVDFPLPTGGSLFDAPRNELVVGIERCKAELKLVNPNCILILGAEPLKILCGRDNSTSWRGSIISTLDGKKAIPSVHPAWIMRGMWKWLTVFRNIDVARAVEESQSPEINLPKREALTGPSFRTTLEYIDLCKKQEFLSFDIETRFFSKKSMGEIACVGIGYREDQAMCVPFFHADGRPYWTIEEEIVVWQALASLLQSDIPKIGQNLSFEWIYFWYHKIFPKNVFIDTMLLHHCLYPDFGGAIDSWGRRGTNDSPGHGLDFICSQYTREQYYKLDGKQWSPSTGDHTLWIYNCKDVMVTFEAAMKMRTEAIEEGTWNYFVNHYMRPFIHAVRAEWQGVLMDQARKAAASIELEARINELQLEINRSVGFNLNVNSGPQMQKLLYEQRGYQVRRKKGTGKPTADKDALKFFAMKNADPVLEKILDLRQTRDLKSDLIDQVLDVESKIHTHYKLGGTDGARWSSTKSILGTGTNLQNIRRQGIARSLFLPS